MAVCQSLWHWWVMYLAFALHYASVYIEWCSQEKIMVLFVCFPLVVVIKKLAKNMSPAYSLICIGRIYTFNCCLCTGTSGIMVIISFWNVAQTASVRLNFIHIFFGSLTFSHWTALVNCGEQTLHFFKATSPKACLMKLRALLLRFYEYKITRFL